MLLFAGRQKDATAKLRAARNAAPDSTYALRADNALHPADADRLSALGADAQPAAGEHRRPRRRRPPRARLGHAQLALAAALQQQGLRTLALAAARKAVRADPRSIDAQVATVVLAFSKDRRSWPSAASGT